MNPKHALLPIALIALAVGCSTLPAFITPTRIEAVTRLAAYSSAKALLIDKPETREQLQKAADGFAALEASEKWDFATAANIAASSGLEWLTSPEGNLALTGGVLFIDLVMGKQLEVSGDANVRAFVVGAHSGLDQALAAKPTVRTAARAAPSASDPIYDRLLREAQATRPR
jgi:hypothetical protein